MITFLPRQVIVAVSNRNQVAIPQEEPKQYPIANDIREEVADLWKCIGRGAYTDYTN